MFMSDFNNLPQSLKTLSRREFLQVCSVGLAGLLLPEPVKTYLSAERWTDDTLYGRITLAGHTLYRKPDPNSEFLQKMAFDSLWEITGVTIGPDNGTLNQIWYELDGLGYAHSGRIQPVRKQTNTADTTIPEDGCLGEVTMPYVDAYSSPDADRIFLYRFYYASTFWILSRIQGPGKTAWYELLDDKYYRSYYVQASHMRLVPEEEMSPISPDVRSEEKQIVVDLASQTLTAYEGEKVVYLTRISSGVRLKEGGFATPKGLFRTIRKRPCRHMSNPANAYGSGFDLPGVPWVSYFTSDGVAFHGAYWHNNYGVPSSHGCINMTPEGAKWIYRWTDPVVLPGNYVYSGSYGTRVTVQ